MSKGVKAGWITLQNFTKNMCRMRIDGVSDFKYRLQKTQMI
jgi:hypothetical protein